MRWLLVLLVVTGGMAANAQAAATDYFTEMARDFGVSPRGPVLIHYFMVKNTTAQPIALGTARVSCGCVSANVIKSQLAPGEVTAVVAQMDTRRIPQANTIKSVIVYVPFLSPFLEEVSLRVQSIARDDLVYSPENLNMGTVKKASPGNATMKVTLFNHPNWEVTEVVSTGVYIQPSLKLVSRQATEVTYEITAKLDPKCPVGYWTAEVVVKTNAPGIDKLRIPVTVMVVTPISVSPDALSLTELKAGVSAEYKVILQGTAPFKITEIQGTDEQVAATSEAKDSRTNHTVLIKLKPKAAGELNRTIEIHTDHQEMPKLTVPLKASVVEK